MIRAWTTARVELPILLAMLAGSTASIAVSSLAMRSGGDALAVVRHATAGAGATSLELDGLRDAVITSDTFVEDDEALASPARVRPRDLYREFVEQAAQRPGSLEEQAEALLASDGPDHVKVALLRALCDSGSPSAAAWLEHAVRTLPDVSTPHAESVPSYAIELLCERSDRKPAREALARLAYDRERVASSLRARAVSRVACSGDAAELERLRGELRRERDETVLTTSLAALEPRRAEWAALCILRDHGREAAAAATGTDSAE